MSDVIDARTFSQCRGDDHNPCQWDCGPERAMIVSGEIDGMMYISSNRQKT